MAKAGKQTKEDGTLPRASMQEAALRALIYCRVSSAKQTIEGSGLESQEHRCRRYAESRGYEVDAVFPDSVTGGGDFMQRPGMVALLSYLEAMQGQRFVVIFDDLKRFARDTEFYLKLRRTMDAHGAILECPNYKFEETPEGRFMETLLAAQGELERQQNRRQVIQKMKARVEKGYWVNHAPIGYRSEKQKGHGRMIVRDAPLDTIIAEAFEGFASGRFGSQAEVQRFFENQLAFMARMPQGKLRLWRVTKILTNPFYAGIINAPKFGVSNVEGLHEPLTSKTTFKAVQDAIAGRKKAPQRVDTNADFPLRGMIACSSCGNSLTGAWSKGKYKHYAYYLCHTRGCEQFQKSIPKAKLENAFEAELKALQPTPGLFRVAAAMFRKAWDQRIASAKGMAESAKAEIRALDKQIGTLMDRLLDTSTPAIIGTYEKKIAALEGQKLLMAEKAENTSCPKATFAQLFELSLTFLASPWKIYEKGSLEVRRTVMKLAFQDRIPYDRETGTLNTKISLPFRALAPNNDQNVEMVLPERIELSTSPLPRECSTSELRQRAAVFRP